MTADADPTVPDTPTGDAVDAPEAAPLVTAEAPDVELPVEESAEGADLIADGPEASDGQEGTDAASPAASAHVIEASADDLVAAEGPDIEVAESTPAVESSPQADADADADADVAAAEAPADEPAAAAELAPAAPRAVPVPRPRPPLPRPAAPSAPSRPAAPATTPAPAAPETSSASTASGEPWGRVDDDGTVSVREADGWRVVGQYPDGTPDEALAYFERKFADLSSEVTLLEVRHRRGGAAASDIRGAARAVSAKLDGAAAVGDLAGLQARLDALTESLAAASETEAAAAREAVDEAIRVRTTLVERAEALAARDPKSVQWKQASADMTAMFDEWQSQQQSQPRLPKSTAQALWKRFRDARSTVDRHRREFYAGLDEAHKSVRDAKARLVEKAEALAPKGEDGIGAYRELLDQWKGAGRAGKKADDALWARFKAAGDALYSARSDREAADAEASREKIDQKRALLAEAKTVVDEKDLAKARSLLTGIQRQWDEIGRVFPRDTERSLDDELRKIEQGVRSREDVDWKRNDPEQKARANDMTRQLTDAIEKLEAEVAAKTAAGDTSGAAKAKEALEARRSWLTALGG